MKTRVSALLVGAAIIVLVSHVCAWGPLAHFSAAPTGGTRMTQNLPDLWLSRQDPGGTTYIGKEVSPFFAWSHACLRNGVANVTTPTTITVGPFSTTIPGSVYPVTPTSYGVPAGIEKAGEDIYAMWTNKVLPANKTEIMAITARGFAGHNAADSAVHFSYFQGGTIYNWLVEHWQKEIWAEYCVYIGVYNGDWDWLGNPTVLVATGCTGDGGAICLAQKVFRKNRQTVDAVPDTTGAFKTITVETKAQVDARISSLDGNYVNGLSQTSFVRYSLIADAAGWDAATLLAKYYQGKAAAATAVGAMP